MKRALGTLLALALLPSVGCGLLGGPTSAYRWIEGDGRPSSPGGVLGVRWTRRLVDPFGGDFVPVENAAAGLDPGRDRVYIGTAEGEFLTYDLDGRRLARYEPGAGVEAAPAVDRFSGNVYLVSEDGAVHAIDEMGELLWKSSVETTVRQPPVLSEDAVFVVAEADAVFALSREDGEVLWNYRRDPFEGDFAVAGHAGLVMHEGRLFTGFTDGTVVALDAASGSMVWERPTSIDIEESDQAVSFTDVDTTPVVIEDTLYVASFSAGLYALELSNGSVRWREPELLDITSLAIDGELAVATSTEQIRVYDLPRRAVRWQRAVRRGAPGVPVLSSGLALIGESRGSLIAFELRTGREIARLDIGSGFSASAAVHGRFGWVLSNGGTLMAFRL